MDVQNAASNVGVGADGDQGDLEQNTAQTDAAEPIAGKKRVKTLLDALAQEDELRLDPQEKQIVDGLLHSTGSIMSQFGIGGVSVYVFYAGRLVPIGTWFAQDILSTVPDKDEMLNPEDAYPNVGLVGALWSDKSFMNNMNHANKAHTNKKKHGLHWKTLSSVIDDPDQSNSHRVETLRSAGLEKATGIKFDVGGIRGMAVYYAEQGADKTILSNPAIENYLCRVSYGKGAILSVIEARRRAIEVIPDSSDLEQNDTDATSTSLESPRRMAHELRSNLHIHAIQRHFVAWLRKTGGAGAQIPACFSWYESLWTAAGTFVGLCIIGLLNRTLKLMSEEEHFLVLGPFGALMMLQYGLLGSPAGQPRTVLIGHAIAGSIALGLTYIPEERLAIWLRQILSVTIANGIMVKLGVACPPASAHSLIYAEGKHDWEFWGLAMLGCLVSFIPAIFFNNLSPRRQYPSFWGYAPARVYNHLVEETKKDTKKAIQVTQATGQQMSKAAAEDTKMAAQVAEETGKATTDAVKQVVQIPTNSTS